MKQLVPILVAISLMLGLVGVAGCSEPAIISTDSETTGYTTYINREYDYFFECPSSWKLRAEHPDHVIVSGIDSGVTQQAAISVSDRDLTLREQVDIYVLVKRSFGFDFVLLSSEPTTARWDWRVDSTRIMGDTISFTTALFKESSHFVYQVELTSEAPSLPDVASGLRHVAESFTHS